MNEVERVIDCEIATGSGAARRPGRAGSKQKNRPVKRRFDWAG